MFTASFGSTQKKPIEVTVHDRDLKSGLGMLVLKTADFEGDFTIFYSDADFLDQMLDLGYAIVNAVNKIKAASPETSPEERYELQKDILETEPHVPFAINDAVEHNEAMATMPDGYDPDQQDIDFPMSPEQSCTLEEVLIPDWKAQAAADRLVREQEKPITAAEAKATMQLLVDAVNKRS